eukprot:c25591_g1_i1 orf=907-3114(+)
MSSVSEDQTSVKSEDLNGPRVKFLCSYGGKIVPKPHDGHLRYVGGETRMVAIGRNTTYSELMTKLYKLFGPNLYFKYQLPNEDLDALISVTCDEDVENMMDEYDKNDLREGSSRLRAFLFPAVRPLCPRNLDSPRVQEFLDEPKSPEQKYVEAVNGIQNMLNVQNDSSAAGSLFQVPDFLFGLDPTNQQHQYYRHPPQQQDGEVFSPTHVHSPSYREQPSPRDSFRPPVTSVTPFVPAVAANPQAECSRIQNPLDTGLRGPVPSTLGLDPLIAISPVNPPVWEAEKTWEGETNAEQRGEQRGRRRSGEIYPDAKLQLDPAAESGLPRVSSRDALAPRPLDGSSDSHSIDRQGNVARKQLTQVPTVVHMDKHKLEEIQVELPGVVQEMRQDVPMGGGRFQRSPDLQRSTQQTNQGNDGVMERVESRRNSGDSNHDVYKRMDGQVVVDNAPHSLTMDGQGEGFRYQEAHRVEENVMLQQPRQGEYEVSPSLHANHIEHMHLGKGHFQQVYWQAHDPQDQQHLQQVPPHEAIRVHSAPVLQRLVPANSSHLPLPGATVHHHVLPSTSNTMRTVPCADTFPMGRFPSPLYRQVGSGVMVRNDSQHLSRAVGPLHENNAPNNGPPLTFRYAAQTAQMHEARVRHSTNQQPSSIPVPASYLEFSKPHAIYDRSAGQMQYPEMVMKVMPDTGIGQIHYPEKTVKANHDPPLVQTHFIEDDMKALPQYTRIASLQDTQGMHSS